MPVLSKENPLVSVWMITYNHEAFIAKAIESVLSQKTNFDFEIVIGEDCSPDGTRKIVEDFESRFPDKIVAIYHDKNVGASRNAYEFTLPACRGKYIACLEGDDFWTDDEKLQKQVDLLEENSDYSCVAHQAEVIYTDSEKQSHLFGGKDDKVFETKDILQHRLFHTSSIMFRNSIMGEVGAIPLDFTSGDRAIYAMISIYGDIFYMKESMCVYRKSNIGISNRIKYEHLKKDFNMLPWLKSLSGEFPVNVFKSFLHLNLVSPKVTTSSLLLLKHFCLFFFYSFSYFPRNLKDIKWGLIFLWRGCRENFKR